MEKEIRYKGLVITVRYDLRSWSVYFTNQPGNFEPLHNVSALRGLASLEAGIEAGKKFVDEHQWELVDQVDWYKIYVRLWWDGQWGYSVRGPGDSANSGDFSTLEEAKSAGIAYAQQKISALNAEMEILKNQRP